MSQAVAAPSTGDRFVTSGNTVQVSPSRRALLAGMLLSPVAAAVTAAPAATIEPESSGAASRRIDAVFWAALARYKDVCADWQAALNDYPNRDMPDADMDAWGERHSVAEYSMLTCRIQTLPALYAKMDAIKVDPDRWLRSEDDGTTVFEAVMWDVERLMMKAHLA